jgi:hypothetical protein
MIRVEWVDTWVRGGLVLGVVAATLSGCSSSSAGDESTNTAAASEKVGTAQQSPGFAMRYRSGPHRVGLLEPESSRDAHVRGSVLPSFVDFLGERVATRMRVLSLGVAFRRHDSGTSLTSRPGQRASSLADVFGERRYARGSWTLRRCFAGTVVTRLLTTRRTTFMHSV